MLQYPLDKCSKGHVSCIAICETKCIKYQPFIFLLKMPGTFADMKVSTGGKVASIGKELI